jgi:hypothetical protein
MNHDVIIAVILHNLQNLYLMSLETSAIAINEVAEEVKKFTFVVAFFWLLLYVLTNLLNQVKNFQLVIKHGFVVIIHFLEEIDAANVFTDMLHHFGDECLE